MEPLDPQDPLWNLLGKGRAVEPRPNFTQNVLRAARQTPQARGWWARVNGWFEDHPSAFPGVAVSAVAAVLLGMGAFFLSAPSRTMSVVVKNDATPAVRTMEAPAQVSAVAAAETPLIAVETQLENIDQVSALLALEDTSSLTDSEIGFLLY